MFYRVLRKKVLTIPYNTQKNNMREDQIHCYIDAFLNLNCSSMWLL